MTDTPPLAGQVVVFAGPLSRMSRREATALVERQLGRVATAVTRETTMLVVDATAPEKGTPDERRVAEAMKLNARYPGRVRLLTEDEFYDLVMAGSGDPGAAPLYTTRAIRGLYPALRDDHLRYLERWGLIRPVSHGKTRQDTAYGFADLAVIRQASAELARGLTFRAVLRTLVAERTGQLAFDFQPAKTDSQPAKVVTLRPRPRMTGGPSDQVGMGAMGGSHAGGMGVGGGGAAGMGHAMMPGHVPVSEDAFAAASSHFAEASALDGGDDEQQQAAILAYRRALGLDPRMVAALVNLANLHYAHDAGPEAEALYEKALLIEPTCFEARFNLGNVYHDSGRFEEAVKCYVQALAVDQGYADAHFYLAVTLEKLGRSGEARPHWIAYQRLAPNGEWVELAREFSD